VNIQNRQKLSEIIKTARGTMSQRAFGKLLGVSATAVQLWERGDTVPDTENLGKARSESRLYSGRVSQLFGWQSSLATTRN
jgi:transcriptional regulator with XRE-family HTH domain